MPKTDAQKLSNKNYRQTEKGKATQRLAYQKYKESEKGKSRLKEASDKYESENKEKRHAYTQSPIGKKNKTINNWKRQGIIDADLGAVYDYMLNETHCMICNKEYKNTQNRQLDHDHEITDDDNIRYICCQKCNNSILL